MFSRVEAANIGTTCRTTASTQKLVQQQQQHQHQHTPKADCLPELNLSSDWTLKLRGLDWENEWKKNIAFDVMLI